VCCATLTWFHRARGAGRGLVAFSNRTLLPFSWRLLLRHESRGRRAAKEPQAVGQDNLNLRAMLCSFLKEKLKS